MDRQRTMGIAVVPVVEAQAVHFVLTHANKEVHLELSVAHARRIRDALDEALVAVTTATAPCRPADVWLTELDAEQQRGRR